MKFFLFGRAKREQPAPIPVPPVAEAAPARGTRDPRRKEGPQPQNVYEAARERAAKRTAQRQVAVEDWRDTNRVVGGASGEGRHASSVAFVLPERAPYAARNSSGDKHAPARDPNLSIPSPLPPQRLTKRHARVPFEDASESQGPRRGTAKSEARRSHLVPQTLDIVPAAPPPRLALAAGKVRHGVDQLRPATHRYDRLGPEVAAWIRDKGLVEVVDGPGGPTDQVTVKVERSSKRLERLGFASKFPSLNRQQQVAVLDVLDEGRRAARDGKELNLTVAVQDKLTNPKLNYRP